MNRSIDYTGCIPNTLKEIETIAEYLHYVLKDTVKAVAKQLNCGASKSTSWFTEDRKAARIEHRTENCGHGR